MTDWLKNLLSKAGNEKGAKAAWLGGSSPIFIYGTGSMGCDIQSLLSSRGLPVSGFIDHREQGTPFLKGVPVFTPEAARVPGQAGGAAVVVLGIHNYQADLSAIVARLIACGFERRLSMVELYDLFGVELGVRYWLTKRDFYQPFEALLEETLSIWADEASRTLFRSILEFRLGGDPGSLPLPDLAHAYHPLDVPAWASPLRFVDCGAYDGDTIADFILHKIQVEALAAFEPDPANFSRLSHFVGSHADTLKDAQLWPCGVHSSTRQLSFDMDRDKASNLSRAGGVLIQCVALDDVLPTFAPNLIKMDIEGAEQDALLGAKNMIRVHTPGLAISVYHRPEHLWQLPLWVQQNMPGKYRLYLRSHAYNDFDLVLYAIPNRG